MFEQTSSGRRGPLRRWIVPMFALAALVAGCGGSASPSKPPSSIHVTQATPTASKPTASKPSAPVSTPTPSAPVSTPAATPSASTSAPTISGYTSQYPAFVRPELVQACEQDGSAPSVCTCFADTVERVVPYGTFAAAVPQISVAQDPSWFVGAAAECGAAI